MCLMQRGTKVLNIFIVFRSKKMGFECLEGNTLLAKGMILYGGRYVRMEKLEIKNFSKMLLAKQVVVENRGQFLINFAHVAIEC